MVDETPVAPDEFEQLKAMFTTHGKVIAAVGAAVLVAAAAVLLYRNHVRSSRDEALRLFFAARSVNDLESVLGQHPSAPTAPLASLRLAKAYFDSGNYEIAQTQYDEFRARYPDHPLVVAAELGTTHCLEAKGQLLQAASDFEAFSQRHPDNFLTSQAIFGRARCLAGMGRLDEARALYENFIVEQPESRWIPAAEEMLDLLRREEARQPAIAAPGEPVGLSLPAPADGQEPVSDTTAAQPPLGPVGPFRVEP